MDFQEGDYVQTPVGRGLVTEVAGICITVSLSDAGNYYGFTWDLTMIKGVG